MSNYANMNIKKITKALHLLRYISSGSELCIYINRIKQRRKNND